MNAVVAIPFGLIALVCFGIGLKTLSQFFLKDYQGNQKKRFRDNLVSNLLFSAGGGCLLVVTFSVSTLESLLSVLPCAFGMSIIILPIGILGAYWRSYTTNKLFGGFMPIVRQQHGFASPNSESQSIHRSAWKPSRNTILIAAITGLLSFCAVFFGLSLLLRWNGSEFTWFLFRVGLGVLAGFGTFMTVGAIALSLHIQRAREQ